MTTNAETGYVEVENGRLYYEVAGAGEPLVFVHGFTLDARMWDDQWDVFARDYRVVRYDARGFGRSTTATAPYTHFEDMQAVVKHLGLERPHAAGLSMGGGIVIDYAINFPDELRSLTLIDSTLGGWTKWSEGFRATVQLNDVAERNGLEAARAAWYAHPFFDPATEKDGVTARLQAIVDGFSGWHWLNQDVQRLQERAPAERVGEIDVPTLVIIGERDVPDFQRIADYLVETIPNARKAVIPDAGHMSNMECPELVNAALGEFLRVVRAG
jgi:pimeloyl-ACP methyl ester carboxylesterase